MKFDLMYYLGLSNQEILTMGLDELFFLYEKTRQTKDKEIEFEKMKLEAMLVASGVKNVKGLFG